MDDRDLPYMQERQWGLKGGATSGARGRLRNEEFMEETISCLAVHRFPFSYCEEFLGNGVTYRHKYYLVALDPRGLPERYDHGIPG
jgi:hypothetical protein